MIELTGVTSDVLDRVNYPARVFGRFRRKRLWSRSSAEECGTTRLTAATVSNSSGAAAGVKPPG